MIVNIGDLLLFHNPSTARDEFCVMIRVLSDSKEEYSFTDGIVYKVKTKMGYLGCRDDWIINNLGKQGEDFESFEAKFVEYFVWRY